MDKHGTKEIVDAPELSAEEKIARLTEQLAEKDRALEVTAKRLEELERQHEADLQRITELEKVAVFDTLTGLLSRYGAALQLEDILAKRTENMEVSERRKKDEKKYEIAYLMLDIDKFKMVNDTYGHAAGDVVLKTVAEKLKQGFRRNDLVSREGGEEITCVLPGMNAQTAYNILFHKFGNKREDFKTSENPRIGFSVVLVDAHGEKLKKNGNETIEDAQGNPVTLQITFSGGIVDFKVGSSLQEVRTAADGLLLTAKETGRNRILMPGLVNTAEGESLGKAV